MIITPAHIISTLLEANLCFSTRTFREKGKVVTEIYSKSNYSEVMTLFTKEFNVELDSKMERFAIATFIH